jgi:hypothetical protein
MHHATHFIRTKIHVNNLRQFFEKKMHKKKALRPSKSREGFKALPSLIRQEGIKPISDLTCRSGIEPQDGVFVFEQTK